MANEDLHKMGANMTAFFKNQMSPSTAVAKAVANGSKKTVTTKVVGAATANAQSKEASSTSSTTSATTSSS